jgi:hypothetical protein
MSSQRTAPTRRMMASRLAEDADDVGTTAGKMGLFTSSDAGLTNVLDSNSGCFRSCPSVAK